MEALHKFDNVVNHNFTKSNTCETAVKQIYIVFYFSQTVFEG